MIDLLKDYSFVIPVFALVVSLISATFAILSWRESNRPLIVVRLTSKDAAGNVGIPLTMLVENTGNRPATNIKFYVEESILDKYLLNSHKETITNDILRIFSDETVIPILANGGCVENSFGLLSDRPDCTWKNRAKFDIKVSYQDHKGRKFTQKIPIVIADNDIFAGSQWRKAKS